MEESDPETLAEILPSRDACCESALEVDADADRDSTVFADSDELTETATD